MRRSSNGSSINTNPKARSSLLATLTSASPARDPRKYFRNNVNEAVAFLDALLDAGLTRVVFSSSCAVYGIQTKMPLSEETSKDPVSTYAETKLFLEKVMQAYSSAVRPASTPPSATSMPPAPIPTAKWASITPRIAPDSAGDSRGPGARANSKFSVKTIRPLTAPPSVTTFTSTISPTDTFALEYLVDGGRSVALNLGTGTGYSVRQVIDTVERISGKGGPRPNGSPPRRRRPGTRLRPRLVRETLGWMPRHSSLEEIVTTAWRWHNEFEKVALSAPSAIIA